MVINMERKYKCFINEKSLMKAINKEYPNAENVIEVLENWGVTIPTILKKIEEYEGAIPVYDLNITLLADLTYIIDDFNLPFGCITELISSLEVLHEECHNVMYYDYSIYCYINYLIANLRKRYISAE